MANVEEIALKIKLQAEKFNQGLQKANQSVKKFGKNVTKTMSKTEKTFDKSTKKMVGSAKKAAMKINKSFSKIGNTLKNSPIASFIAGGALVSFAQQAIEANRELDIWSRTLEIAPQRLKTFQIALESIGFSGEKTTDILKDVNEKLGELIEFGTGEAVDMAKRLGLSAEDFKKNDAIGNLQLIVAKMDELQIKGRSRITLLEMLANDASKLAPLLKNNAAELEKLQKAARESGRVLTDVQQKNLTDLGNATKQAWDNLKGLAQVGLAKLAPVLTMLAKLAGVLLDSFKGLVGGLVDLLNYLRKETTAAFKSITMSIGDTIDAVKKALRISFVAKEKPRSQEDLAQAGTINALMDAQFGIKRAGKGEDQANAVTRGLIRSMTDRLVNGASKIDNAGKTFTDVGGTMQKAGELLMKSSEKYGNVANTKLGQMITGGAEGEISRILQPALRKEATSQNFERRAQSLFKDLQTQDLTKSNRSNINQKFETLKQELMAVKNRVGSSQSVLGMQKTFNELVKFYRARQQGIEKDKAKAELKVIVAPSKEFAAEVKKLAEEGMKVTLAEQSAQIGT